MSRILDQMFALGSRENAMAHMSIEAVAGGRVSISGP